MSLFTKDEADFVKIQQELEAVTEKLKSMNAVDAPKVEGGRLCIPATIGQSFQEYCAKNSNCWGFVASVKILLIGSGDDRQY